MAVVKYERFQRIWTPRTPEDSYSSLGDVGDSLVVAAPWTERCTAGISLSNLFLFSAWVSLTQQTFLTSDISLSVNLKPIQVTTDEDIADSISSDLLLSSIALYDAITFPTGPLLDRASNDLNLISLRIDLPPIPKEYTSSDLQIVGVRLSVPNSAQDTENNSINIVSVNLSSS